MSPFHMRPLTPKIRKIARAPVCLTRRTFDKSAAGVYPSLADE